MDAAVERIKAAIGGKTHGEGGKPRYAEVCPADVLAVAKQITEPTHVTTGLVAGATGALEGVALDLHAEARVWQFAHQLQELLDLAGGRHAKPVRQGE